MLTNNGELTFNVRGIQLVCQSWGNPADSPVLALHGWMDNSNSFAEQAKYLSDMHLIGLDMAGHGKSDYRSLDSHYNIWTDVAEIIEIADQLKLEQFSLLAHSRGAFSSLLCAAAFPNRIKQLVMIDAFAGLARPAKNAPEKLARSIKTSRRFSRFKRTVYSSYEQAIESRRATSKLLVLSDKAVRTLAERGLKQVEGGYSWSADPRLQAISELYLTEEIYQEFLDSVECPVTVITGEQSAARQSCVEAVARLVPDNSLYKLHTLPGGHHLHLEQETAPAVAQLISSLSL